jgi:hypothetical protein
MRHMAEYKNLHEKINSVTVLLGGYSAKPIYLLCLFLPCNVLGHKLPSVFLITVEVVSNFRERDELNCLPFCYLRF